MRRYVVRQGDYLARLALRHGFAAEEVWNLPENRALAASRSPELLCPGDILHIPESAPPSHPVQRAAVNRYRATVPRVTVEIIAAGAAGPLAGAAYQVVSPGTEPPRGTTDGTGKLTLSIPISTPEVDIHFPGHRLTLHVAIGHLDPIDTPSGLWARLDHLGFAAPETEESSDVRSPEELARTLTLFQRARGLPPTGQCDEATRSALLEAHGS